MKKIKYLLPSLCLIFAVACTEGDSDNDTAPETDTSSQAEGKDDETTIETPDVKDDVKDETVDKPVTEEPKIETPEKPKDCKIVNKDGLIIIEAESFDLKGSWKVVEDPIASGGKYIEYFGFNSYQSYEAAAPNEITVKFTSDVAKTYLVRWFMRQPSDAHGDLSNDAYMYFVGDLGLAKRKNEATGEKEDVTLTHYEKFVSRGKTEFTYGGALDLHKPKESSWMRVKIPAPGEYTLKIRGRSKGFQLDKIVLSTIPEGTLEETAKPLTEALSCE